jgi:Major tropism determinant N-terminal domain
VSEQLQLRRGTAANVAASTGAQGEVFVDTTNNRLVLQDGLTAGGFPAAKIVDVARRTTVSDTAYAALATDRLVAYTALSAARVVTLPAASAFPAGFRLLVVDETGNCSPTVTITVDRAGADTIDGATSAAISSAYGFLALESNGANAWTIVDQVGLAAQSTHGANIAFGVIEGLASGLSGASVTTAVQIPANSIVFAVSERVTTTIAGATSFEVGVAGNASQFGSGLSLPAGSTNFGLTGPTAFYAAAAIVLTAIGGNFTAGAVRLAVHYMTISPPTS